jgi:hypothetical protein
VDIITKSKSLVLAKTPDDFKSSPVTIIPDRKFFDKKKFFGWSGSPRQRREFYRKIRKPTGRSSSGHFMAFSDFLGA